MRMKIARPRRLEGLRRATVIPSRVRHYLLPYEKDMVIVHRHPGLLAGHAILLAFACAAASLLTAITNSGAYILSAAWGACSVILLYLIFRAAEWGSTYFVVTRVRLIFITGLVVRKVTTVPMREIRDLELRRSWPGRLLGYGTFIAEPSRPGYRIPKMNYMPYPEPIFLEMVGVLFPEKLKIHMKREPGGSM